MEKVLHNVELLEHILLRVDIRTLLTACTGVCCLWGNLIKTSPSLQKKLFLVPGDATFVSMLLGCDSCLLPYKHPDTNKAQNPLLSEFLPCLFSARRDSLTGTGEKLVDVMARGDAPLAGFSLRDTAGEPFFPDIEWEKLPCRASHLAWQRPEASWRQMLLQQPPVKKLLIVVDEEHDTCEPSWCVQVYHGPHYAAQNDSCCEKRSEPYELGLRMGELIQQLEHIVWHSTNVMKLHWHTSWWMPELLRSRAITLAELSRKMKREIEFVREDTERPGHGNVEQVSTKVSRNTSLEDQMKWIDEQYSFEEDDGADLTVHILLSF